MATAVHMPKPADADMPLEIKRIIRVGVIGAGEVAQTTHLPVMTLMSHRFKCVALCDVSRDALDWCGRKFNIPSQNLYSKAEDLVRQEDVDLVMIMSADEYHATHAVMAADARKHVFIEKPMALSVSDAEAILAAKQRNNVIVWIGYMRRYASAFEQAVSMVRSMKKIHYARVRDIIGMNHLFITQSGTFPQRVSDYPTEAIQDRMSRAHAMVSEALGEGRANSPVDVATYRLLGGLGSHDLSAMREMLGPPKKVIGAGRNGSFVTALFDYGDFVTTYETGIDTVGKFDAHLEVYGDNMRIKVEYDTPYVKGLPVTLTIGESDANGAYTERVVRPTYEDPYTLQYHALHAAIAEGGPVKTTPEDAKQDLATFRMLLDALSSPDYASALAT